MNLYPGYAYPSADATTWTVVVQGRVFEPDSQSIFSKSVMEAVNSLSLFMPGVDRSLIALQERLKPFAVKGRSDAAVPLRVQDKTQHLAKSASDGYFEDRITVSQPSNPNGGWLSYGTEPCKDDKRTFSGQALIIPASGVSVISDVEGVLQAPSDPGLMFTEPKATPGLASQFTAWSGEGAAFHYVSAQPWEWTSAVQNFLKTNQFPSGSLHLQKLSWADANTSLSSAIAMLARVVRPSTAHTGPVIEELLQRFPRRQFILVGSSAEPTPELYAGIARRYPEQIRLIYIRQRPGPAPKWSEIFQGLPAAQWKVVSL